MNKRENKGTKAFQRLSREYAEHLFGDPQCYRCNHLLDYRKLSCRAFDEIPHEIFVGDHDHRTPYPGDHGIQFEQIER